MTRLISEHTDHSCTVALLINTYKHITDQSV